MPYRLLEPVPELSHTDPDQPDNTDNLIVQGDNLHALKALLPRYAGQVKCIYIDPPYNTGNEGWVYNDTDTHERATPEAPEVRMPERFTFYAEQGQGAFSDTSQVRSKARVSNMKRV